MGQGWDSDGAASTTTRIGSLPLQQSLRALSRLPIGQLRHGRAALPCAHAPVILLPLPPLMSWAPSRSSTADPTADPCAKSPARQTAIAFGAAGIAQGLPLGSLLALLAFGLAVLLLQARPVGRSASG